MNINYKPSQIELFPANAASLEDLNKPRFLFANLTLTLENLVILSIFIIMVSVFAYAIGVEQGKKSVAQALDDRVSQAWNVEARRSRAMAMPVTASLVKPVTAVAVKPVTVSPVTRVNTLKEKPAGALKKAAVVPAVKNSGFLLASAGRLTVQLATYRSESFARDEAITLRAKGIQTFLVKSGSFWLVCAGQFHNKEETQGYIKRLPAKYREAQVRRF